MKDKYTLSGIYFDDSYEMTRKLEERIKIKKEHINPCTLEVSDSYDYDIKEDNHPMNPITREELLEQELMHMQEQIDNLYYIIREMDHNLHAELSFTNSKVNKAARKLDEHANSFHAMLICGKDNSNESNIS